MAGLFDFFDKGDKAQWKAGIERELKGKSFDSLVRKFGSDPLEPFYIERPERMQLLQANDIANNWAIGACFSSLNPDLNHSILQALSEGVESISIQILSAHPLAFSKWLKEVRTDWIAVHLEFEDLAAAKRGTEAFYQFLIEQQLDPGIQLGSVRFPNQSTAGNDWVLFVDSWRGKFPLLQFFDLSFPIDAAQIDGLTNNLAKVGQQTESVITALLKRNIPLESIAALIQYRVILSHDFLINIATIRALRLLIGNIWDKFGFPIFADQVNIQAFSTEFTNGENADIHRIAMANQAMSAVIGGVTSLFVKAAAHIDQASDFGQRMATNLQHILKYESFFDRVQDPLYGSYSIEHMTWSLANQAVGIMQVKS